MMKKEIGSKVIATERWMMQVERNQELILGECPFKS
jgi:hypothetical protein